MRRILTILLLFSIVLSASAMDIRQQNINRIKKSKAFLYSDITMSSKEDATSHAYEQIQQEIINWARERTDKKISNVPATELNKAVDTIWVMRANMHRVVAFARKTKIARLFPEWKLMIVEGLDTDENTPDENVEKEPQESQKAEEPKDSMQYEQKKDTVANEAVRTLLKQNFLGRKGGVIEQIKKAKNFFELKQIMEPLKEKGDILDYGKYASAEKPEDCYLVVYDPAGNIKALLGKGEDLRQNLKTGKDDSIKNYRGCGAIWFTIKE